MMLDRIPSLRRTLSNSNHHNCLLSVELTVSELHTVLKQCARVCRGEDRVFCDYLQNCLLQRANHHSSSTASVSSLFHSHELEQVSVFLASLLSSNEYNLPMHLVAAIHSCLGQLQKQDRQYERSIRSLLHALWIQEKAKTTSTATATTSDESVMAVAITEHRLGLVYAKTGDWNKAIHLLQKALIVYKKYGPQPHPKNAPTNNIIVETELVLQKLHRRRQERDLRDSQHSISEAAILEDIIEVSGEFTFVTSSRELTIQA